MALPFEPQPYRVVSKAGSSVQSPSGAQYKRKSSHVKISNEPESPTQGKDENVNCEETPKTNESKGDNSRDEPSTPTQPDSTGNATSNEATVHVRVRSNLHDSEVASPKEESSTRPTRLRKVATKFKDFKL